MTDFIKDMCEKLNISLNSDESNMVNEELKLFIIIRLKDIIKKADIYREYSRSRVISNKIIYSVVLDTNFSADTLAETTDFSKSFVKDTVTSIITDNYDGINISKEALSILVSYIDELSTEILEKAMTLGDTISPRLINIAARNIVKCS